MVMIVIACCCSPRPQPPPTQKDAHTNNFFPSLLSRMYTTTISHTRTRTSACRPPPPPSRGSSRSSSSPGPRPWEEAKTTTPNTAKNRWRSRWWWRARAPWGCMSTLCGTLSPLRTRGCCHRRPRLYRLRGEGTGTGGCRSRSSSRSSSRPLHRGEEAKGSSAGPPLGGSSSGPSTPWARWRRACGRRQARRRRRIRGPSSLCGTWPS